MVLEEGTVVLWLMFLKVSIIRPVLILKKSLPLGGYAEPSRVSAIIPQIWKLESKIWFMVFNSRNKDFLVEAIAITNLFFKSLSH